MTSHHQSNRQFSPDSVESVNILVAFEKSFAWSVRYALCAGVGSAFSTPPSLFRLAQQTPHPLTACLPACLPPCPQLARSEGLPWVESALLALPEEAASAVDRQRFLAACQTLATLNTSAPTDEAHRALWVAVVDLSDLCRRSWRAETAALRALLPQELQYIVR